MSAMVWGWNYAAGPGEYTQAFLERTRDAAAFEAWCERESERRARLRHLLAFSAGQSPYAGLAPFSLLSLQNEAVDLAGLSSKAHREMVRWHLATNLFPAVPESMVDACVAANHAMRSVNPSPGAMIELPSTVSYRTREGRVLRCAPAAEIVRQHSLSRFVATDEDALRRAADREWHLDDALHAWQAANQGRWELSSPAPSWPEFVTLLLVGRNQLEAGEDDDPAEQDLIRSWWGDGGWRRGYNAGWWDTETVYLMSLPLPEPAPGRSKGHHPHPLVNGDLAAVDDSEPRHPAQLVSEDELHKFLRCYLEYRALLASGNEARARDLAALLGKVFAPFRNRGEDSMLLELISRDLRQRIVDYFPFLALELRQAGMLDLAESLWPSDPGGSRPFHIPQNFEAVIRIAITHDLASSMRVAQLWEELMRIQTTGAIIDDNLVLGYAVAFQRDFGAAKRAEDTIRMHELQAGLTNVVELIRGRPAMASLLTALISPPTPT